MAKAKQVAVPAVYQLWLDEQMRKVEQSPLFGLPNSIKTMHRMYGAADGKACGACVHCVMVNGGSRDYPKCDLSKITNGAATDWRKKWPACGKFEVAEVKK